jgi:hypothetical protein
MSDMTDPEAPDPGDTTQQGEDSGLRQGDEQLTRQRDEAGLPKDDERLIREQIEETGEPIRDRLGNADGAS